MPSHTRTFLPGGAANFLLTGQQWSHMSFNQDVSVCVCVCLSHTFSLSVFPFVVHACRIFWAEIKYLLLHLFLFSIFFFRHIRLTSVSNNYFFFYKAITFCHSITRLHIYKYFYKHLFPLLLITWEGLTKCLLLQDTKRSNKSRCNRRTF